MRCNCPYKQLKKAFTLIEILVVISMIGLLFGLLLPAIQSSREASRRAECTNRLRQIGTALASHHAAHNRFPPGFLANIRGEGGRLAAIDPFSVHFQLLPYLEQTTLYNIANMDNVSAEGSIPHIRDGAANRTIRNTKLVIFLCPSDPQDAQPGNNYLATVGPFPLEFDSSATPGGGGGAFPGFYPTAGQDFTDGLSQTVGFSERLQGYGSETSYHRGRDFWYSGIWDLRRPSNSDEAVKACAALGSGRPDWWHAAGRSWTSGRYADTLYNHVAPPNWDGMDCSLNVPFGKPGDISAGVITARSLHSGGVNALVMDGSVRFIKQGINHQVWRALGSRSGGEVLSADSF